MPKPFVLFAALVLGHFASAAAQTATVAAPEPAPAPVAQAKPATNPPAPCAASGGLLPGSGLCRADALARLPQTRRNAWQPPVGCDVIAQEAPLSDGRWLLYAAQRCGDRAARLAIAPGDKGAFTLSYAETARNAALAGKPVLTLVEGHPAPYEAIYALVMPGIPPKHLRHCALRTPDIEGYPIDAYVFDLPPAEARKTAALDAPCGPYGRSALTDSYWRLFDGIGVFYVFGDDQPEFDPASLAVFKPAG